MWQKFWGPRTMRSMLKDAIPNRKSTLIASCIVAASSYAICESVKRTSYREASGGYGIGLRTLELCECESIQRGGGLPFSRNFAADAVELASPAVVSIMRGNNGSGSGFIINSDGFIVTNEHVVRGALNQKVQVIMWSGRILEGYVHSMDEKTDIALVKIINSGGEKFPHAILGSSGDVRQGEFVLALGSPFSQYFRNTVTFGIVSALARNTIDSSKHVRLSYIQTDANMHPGNSGGPLINLDGHVIGVCNSRCERVPTFNFAIPIDIVAIAVDQLMRNKRVVLPYIGLRFQQAYEGSPQPLSRKVKERLIVKSVEPSSPAELAGIQGGDVLISVNGNYIIKSKDLINEIGYNIGKKHIFKVARNGNLMEFSVIAASERE